MLLIVYKKLNLFILSKIEFETYFVNIIWQSTASNFNYKIRSYSNNKSNLFIR